MSTKRVLGLLFIVIAVIVGLVGTAMASVDPNWEEAGVAPTCKQVDSPYSPYVVHCTDTDITSARIKEINARCTADWDATHFTLIVVEDAADDQIQQQKWDDGAIYWSVVDADGNVVRGEYHR